MDLALFDFDGTITVDPTYPAFVRLAVHPGRRLAGGIVLAPLIVAYRIGLLSDRRIRSAISRVAFVGDDAARLRRVGADYARDVVPRVIRPEAVERIEWHKARGDRVVVVSAGLDVYLQPWCEMLGIEVVCTRLEVKADRVTGRYLFGDCCGAEKARRIRERYNLTDYDDIYCYGDSEEDRQLLAMGTRRYFRWSEVVEIPVASRGPPPGGANSASASHTS